MGHGTGMAPARGGGFFRGLREDLRALGGSPRDLWVIYAVKFLESVAYFSVWSLLVVYLSEELGYSDVEAGAIAGAWQTAVSLLVFCSGFVVDAIGVRLALLLGVLSCLVGRLLLVAAHSRAGAIAGLCVMTWGVSSMIPTMTAGVRQYTRSGGVSFGFSFFYVMMNLGAFAAGPTISYFRRAFARPRPVVLPGGMVLRLTSAQWVFAMGVVVTLASLVLVLTLMRDERPSHTETAQHEAPTSLPPARQHPWTIFRAVIAEPTFWRLMLFVSLLVLVRAIFQHAHLTWPKYALREFGRTFPFASYWSVNPLMIILLTPVVTALTRRRAAFDVILFGATLSALSVFFMAASTTVAASVLFIVTLSLGEAFWSPRLYEYTSTIAPPGREASYMGLSQVPLFFAKMIVGPLSGVLLANFCPPEGPRQSKLMWALIGASTLLGPLVLYILRHTIQPPQPAQPAELASPAAPARAAPR